MKSNLFKLAIIALLGAFILTGCGPNWVSFYPGSAMRITGSGRVVTESRTVSEFDGVVVNGAGRILIDQTGTESLEVTADDNVLPYIITEVRDGKLAIGFQPNTLPDHLKDLTFRLTVKKLNSLDLNGAAVVEGSDLDTDTLTVNVSGAAAVRLLGRADRLDVNLTGAGAFNAEHMQSKSATVTNSGAGAAIVNVSDELNATINGIGAITYIGNPKVTRGVHGLGVVSRRK